MKKQNIFITVGVVLVAVGAGIVSYPHISNYLYRSETAKTINDYDTRIEEMYSGTDIDKFADTLKSIGKNNDTDYTAADYVKDNNITADGKNYDWALISMLREQMEQYNKQLLEDGQYLLNDPFSYEQPSFLLSTYSISDNVFGYISAPSIDMELPIYLGASQENMNYGAVHLSYSSMPIGGESTNAVFAAHRGYVGKIFFDNIVFLENGDDIYITNPWGKLHYKVTETEVISPDEINKCYIEEGKDKITLLTCHPYGSSEFRYMVVCERAD